LCLVDGRICTLSRHTGIGTFLEYRVLVKIILTTMVEKIFRT
jgi:hypothetical protein